MISGLQRKLALGDRPRVWKTGRGFGRQLASRPLAGVLSVCACAACGMGVRAEEGLAVVSGCGTARYRPGMRLTLLSLPSALPYP
jgi:hypothetical protein